jgi:integrase
MSRRRRESLNDALARATLRAGFDDRARLLDHTHALRHMYATSLLEQTEGDRGAAAAALGTTVETVIRDYLGGPTPERESR